jgi:hypothetical protein
VDSKNVNKIKCEYGTIKKDICGTIEAATVPQMP